MRRFGLPSVIQNKFIDICCAVNLVVISSLLDIKAVKFLNEFKDINGNGIFDCMSSSIQSHSSASLFSIKKSSTYRKMRMTFFFVKLIVIATFMDAFLETHYFNKHICDVFVPKMRAIRVSLEGMTYRDSIV